MARTAKDWRITVRVKTVEPMTRAQVRFAMQSVADYPGTLMLAEDGLRSLRVINADEA
jgi:hypothetical protein